MIYANNFTCFLSYNPTYITKAHYGAILLRSGKINQLSRVIVFVAASKIWFDKNFLILAIFVRDNWKYKKMFTKHMNAYDQPYHGFFISYEAVRAVIFTISSS